MRIAVMTALQAVACVLACLRLAAAVGPEEGAVHRLGWVLEPGDVRRHAVQLELDTRLVIRSGGEETVRQTSTELSFVVRALGLRR